MGEFIKGDNMLEEAQQLGSFHKPTTVKWWVAYLKTICIAPRSKAMCIMKKVNAKVLLTYNI